MSELKLSTEELSQLWFEAQDQALAGFPAPFHFAKAVIELQERRTQPEATKPAQDLGAAILEQAAQACDQQADGTNGAYRTACLQCANVVRELRDAALASPAYALVAGDRVDLENWNTQMAGVKALLECTEGELECIDGKLLKDYVEHVKRIYAAIQAQKDGHG